MILYTLLSTRLVRRRDSFPLTRERKQANQKGQRMVPPSRIEI